MISLAEGNAPLILYLIYPKIRYSIIWKIRRLKSHWLIQRSRDGDGCSKSVEEGAKAIVCASTGNTSAATGAYATRVGIKAYVVIQKEKSHWENWRKLLCMGRTLFRFGNFDEALKAVRDCETEAVALVNSVNLIA